MVPVVPPVLVPVVPPVLVPMEHQAATWLAAAVQFEQLAQLKVLPSLVVYLQALAPAPLQNL
jgi:hypothetical protein